MILNELKIIDLRNSQNLIETPNLRLSLKSSNELFSSPVKRQRRSSDPMAMFECSLSGLWSLTELDLSHCNLQEIPDAFDYLSSLLILNLEGNKFIWLPKSMIQLSNLQDLFLRGCSNLRSLPKLPSNIKYIDAAQCTSLETLSSGSEYDFQPALQLLNCVKLIENQGYGYMSTMLRRYFINDKHYHGQDKLAHYIYVPGDFCNKLMGIAMCIVYVFRQHGPFELFDQLDFEDFGHNKYTRLEVTKCGAHLVFKQDVEDLKQTMVGSSSCSITPYEDDFDRAGPSGECTSNDVDAPHPKWIQQPNLIENWIGNFNSCTQKQGNSYKEANGSDGDGVELGSATQKLKDSRKVTRKYHPKRTYASFLALQWFCFGWNMGLTQKINLKPNGRLDKGQEHTTRAEKCPMQQERSKGKKKAKKGDKLSEMTQAIQSFTELTRVKFIAGQAKASGSTKHVGESAGIDGKFSIEKAIGTLNGHKDLNDMTFFKVQKKLYNCEARIFFMTVPDNRRKDWMEFIAKESD
nr:disease resistance protein adr2 [Quercus suber]